MKDVLNKMIEAEQLDICTAFVDAYGIATVGRAAQNEGFTNHSEYRSMKLSHDTLTVQCIIPKYSEQIIDKIV